MEITSKTFSKNKKCSYRDIQYLSYFQIVSETNPPFPLALRLTFIKEVLYHVIFHAVWFFNINEDVTKNNWLRKFGNDGVCFSKATSMQCTDSSSTVERLHLRFFLEYVPNTSYLKKYFDKKGYGGPTFYTGTNFIRKHSSC